MLSIRELEKIPHVRAEALQRGRVLPTLTFHTPEDGWELWLDANGSLIPLKGVPGDADYFSRSPEAESDLCVFFYDLIGRQILSSRTAGYFSALRHDLNNLGASLAKIDFFVAQLRQGAGPEVSRFAQTEFEYLLIVCRSMFDLFQRFLAGFWKQVKLHASPDTPTPNLPPTFSKFALEAEQPRTAQQLREKYSLPNPLAESVARAAAFFQSIRKSRDLIVHHGHSFPVIFGVEQGFAMQADTEPFSGFGVWRSDTFLPNNLASLRPVLAYLVWRTVAAFDQILRAVQGTISLSADPVPGFSLFIRSWNTATLRQYSLVSIEDPWWPLVSIPNRIAMDEGTT